MAIYLSQLRKYVGAVVKEIEGSRSDLLGHSPVPIQTEVVEIQFTGVDVLIDSEEFLDETMQVTRNPETITRSTKKPSTTKARQLEQKTTETQRTDATQDSQEQSFGRVTESTLTEVS